MQEGRGWQSMHGGSVRDGWLRLNRHAGQEVGAESLWFAVQPVGMVFCWWEVDEI
jgi:hypothetical protein